jgi:hypothetical protein
MNDVQYLYVTYNSEWHWLRKTIIQILGYSLVFNNNDYDYDDEFSVQLSDILKNTEKTENASSVS